MRAGSWLTAFSTLAIIAPIAGATASGFSIGNVAFRDCYTTAAFGKKTDSSVCTGALSALGLTNWQRAGIYVNRSVIRLRAFDYGGALADADAALTLNSRLAEAYVTRGVALLGTDRAAEALAALDRGIDLGTQRIHIAYYNRGIAKELLKDARGAYNDYKASHDVRPDFTLGVEQLARFRVVRYARASEPSQFISTGSGLGAAETPSAMP